MHEDVFTVASCTEYAKQGLLVDTMYLWLTSSWDFYPEARLDDPGFGAIMADKNLSEDQCDVMTIVA